MAQCSKNGEEVPFLTLPEDLLTEFFCTFPVILLLRLQRVCKRFNKLISDPDFVEKHLRMSKNRPHLMVTSEIDPGKDDLKALYHSPISSVFSTSTVVPQELLCPPNDITDKHNLFYANVMYSCNGIFCGMIKDGYHFLWNPSIKKFKVLHHLKFPWESVINFGYDKSIDKYKFVAVSVKNKVSVHTLGTDTSWKSIQDIPFGCHIDRSKGLFVGGAVNWLANDDPTSSLFVLSLDLAKESYQRLSLPAFENKTVWSRLGVVSDCLYVLAVSDMFSDVWIMTQYGQPGSWTKYSIPNTMMRKWSLEARYALYLSADDQMLLQCYEMEYPNDMSHDMRSPNNMKLVVYDFNTGTLNIPEFQKYDMEHPKVYIESLKTLPKDSTAT